MPDAEPAKPDAAAEPQVITLTAGVLKRPDVQALDDYLNSLPSDHAGAVIDLFYARAAKVEPSDAEVEDILGRILFRRDHEETVEVVSGFKLSVRTMTDMDH